MGTPPTSADRAVRHRAGRVAFSPLRHVGVLTSPRHWASLEAIRAPPGRDEVPHERSEDGRPPSTDARLERVLGESDDPRECRSEHGADQQHSARRRGDARRTITSAR